MQKKINSKAKPQPNLERLIKKHPRLYSALKKIIDSNLPAEEKIYQLYFIADDFAQSFSLKDPILKISEKRALALTLLIRCQEEKNIKDTHLWFYPELEKLKRKFPFYFKVLTTELEKKFGQLKISKENEQKFELQKKRILEKVAEILNVQIRKDPLLSKRINSYSDLDKYDELNKIGDYTLSRTLDPIFQITDIISSTISLSQQDIEYNLASYEGNKKIDLGSLFIGNPIEKRKKSLDYSKISRLMNLLEKHYKLNGIQKIACEIVGANQFTFSSWLNAKNKAGKKVNHQKYLDWKNIDLSDEELKRLKSEIDKYLKT